jgi:hypothetical protein
MLMKGLLLVAAISIVATAPLAAETLQIKGKTGYLGEYEIKATLIDQAGKGKKEFSGRMTVTHVGLCTHAGPDEIVSDIKVQYVGWTSRVEATFDFDGAACNFRGPLSQSTTGVMTCAGKPAVPFTLWRQ